MENELQPPFGELATPNHEEPEQIIDVRETFTEPTGFELLETYYGSNPESLAQNSALALILLMQATDKTLVLGLEHDTTLLGEKSQIFTDSILTAMASEDRHAGYSVLASIFTDYAGFSSQEHFCEHLWTFVEEKSLYLNQFQHMSFLERLEPLTRLRDTVYLITYAAERMLDATLDGLSMSYEGGDMSIFNQDLFREYCTPFFDEPMHEVVAVDIGQHGISGQVRKRLTHEAHYLRKTEFSGDYDSQ